MMKECPEPEETQQSREGSAAHEVGEQLIRQGTASGKSKVLQVGDTASNGVIIDAEMVEAATLYANDFLVRFYQWQPVAGMLKGGVEAKLKIPRVHKQCFGTTDNYLYNPVENHLINTDFKYGRVWVDAFENWQEICYVAGLETELKLPPDCKVTIKIVQPRAFGRGGSIRTWDTTIKELRPYLTDLAYNAETALSDRAILNSGPHCLWCDSRYRCEVALDAGIALYELAGAPLPVELSPQALGLQCAIVERAIEQLKGLKTGYSAQIEALIKSGKNVPGWGVEPTVGHLVWTRPVDEVIAMGKLLGKKLAKPEEAITPTQAKALGVNEDMIAAYSARPSRGLKLVRDDGTKAARIFT